MKKSILVLLFFVAACAPSQQERESAILSRASYDLKCPPDKIKLTMLKDGAEITSARLLSAFTGVGSTQQAGMFKYGAEGCGQQKVYDNVGKDVYTEGGAPNSVIINHPNVINNTTTIHRSY